ncbi:MAG: DUF5990 family protein [Saprospiraceae bacterium]
MAEINVRIILYNPPEGVEYGIQEGSGLNYTTLQLKKSTTGNLSFEFKINYKPGKEGVPDFGGKIVHGNISERFIYIDIGTYAGIHDSNWSRRLKIPLRGITIEMISQLLSNNKKVLEIKVQGTGKDGTPSCGTIKPFEGWRLTLLK